MFYISSIDKQKIDNYLQKHLKESRLKHSFGVEKMAISLAKAHGVDEELAGFCGRYHDIAKCHSQEMMDRMIREYGLDHFYLGKTSLAHSKLGAEILYHEFNIKDKDALNAIAYHTTGRWNMSLLEEIIYVADAIDETRVYNEVEWLRQKAHEDLDYACLYIMNYTIDRIKSLGRDLDEDTLLAKKYIEERMNKRNDK